MAKKLRIASWVLLTLVGVLTLLGSGASALLAYSDNEDQIGPVALSELAAGRADVATAIRGRRGTAAAFGAAYSALFLLVVLVPYRRGDVWAWWALLTGSVVLALFTLARIPALGLQAGAGVGGIQLGVVLLALLLDASRLRS
jgi:hypothetical protein